MTIAFLQHYLQNRKWDALLQAQYRPYRQQLHRAGLSERKLRGMTPDDRVRALEAAQLNPYDFFFLGNL